jgi:hypothetical protein
LPSLYHRCFGDLLRGRFPLDAEREASADGILERLSWHKCLATAASLDGGAGTGGRLAGALARVRLDVGVAEEVYVRRTAAVHDGLARAGVPFYPLKGPFWGTLLYPPGVARHLGDLDLLVPPGAAAAAHEVLAGLDMEAMRPTGVSAANAREALDAQGEISYRGRGPNGFIVEIHGTLVVSPRFRRSQALSLDGFHAGGRAAEWRGFRFPVPRREDWLLYVLLHGACHHQFARFLHLMDASYFFDREGKYLDRERLTALAREWRVERALFHSLRLLNAFREAPVPVPPGIGPGGPYHRALAMPLTPEAVLLADDRRGNFRRNLFRLAIS